MQKWLSLLCGLALLVFLGASAAPAAPTPSFSDAWDISQGNTVLSNSPIHGGFDVRDMFGGTYGSTEPGNTIFGDGNVAGTVLTVAWATPSPVTLFGCNLFAGHDPDWNGGIRAFTHFVLQYQDAGNAWQTLVDFYPSYPYDPGSLSDYTQLAQAFTFASVTGKNFQAFFTQRDNYWAPRVYELDAVTTAPLPGAFILLSSGLAGLIAWRRRL